MTNIRGDYEERLAILNIRTLEERRLRGDLIETYKILTGKSDVDPKTWFSPVSETDPAMRTRAMTGYLNLVQPTSGKTDIRKNFFSQRVVSHWNQLPEHVKKADKTNRFKEFPR